MKVLVLGGDGFCGWPTSLHLSFHHHEVVIVDNLSRRKIDIELFGQCKSLTPICGIEDRIKRWKELTGKTVKFYNIDIAHDYIGLRDLFLEEKPNALVHFAEQRSAPYSMKNPTLKRYTVDNNINATHNILVAIAETQLDVHVVHLGTMGVYGYESGGLELPEGYLNVTFPNGENREILHPAYPGSVYHMTKTLDALMFQFYNKNDKISITDLHQGIVWGISTEETNMDKSLINRYDYDGDYGTVLNRFVVQAAVGLPLTVYGPSGGQQRAFIHIRDTVRCIRIVIENPPTKGDKTRIFNQATEVHKIEDLAKIVAKQFGENDVTIQHLEDPRVEKTENTLKIKASKLPELGLSDPTKLDTHLVEEIKTICNNYKSRVDTSVVLPTSFWNMERREAYLKKEGVCNAN